MKATKGEIISYANSYVPPSFGIAEPSSAKLSAVNKATVPAIIIETITAGPAEPTAMPSTTKIPAPIIAPMPIDVASKRFKVLFNSTVFPQQI